MTTPQTLLQMAGVALPIARLSDAALVIIDAQREYRDGNVRLEGIEPALARLATLLARARAAGTPILHVAHQGAAGGMFDPTNGNGDILEQAAPVGGEPTIMKRLPNAFAGTDLQDRLKSLGRDHLILTGFMTHMCISASARAALDLGHKTTIAADCTATRALPAHDGGTPLPAETVHRTALAELADRFAAIVPSEAIGA